MEEKEAEFQDCETYKEMFSFFDKDGDGKIATPELQVLLTLLGQYPTPKEFDELLSDCDTSREGQVTFHNFETILQKRMDLCNPEEELKWAINFFTKDGVIKMDEMLYAVTNTGENRLTEDEVRELSKEIALTQGQITSDDFVKALSL